LRRCSGPCLFGRRRGTGDVEIDRVDDAADRGKIDRLGIGHGTKVIDVGCGAGRHSFEAFRRGADVVAFDQDATELNNVDTMFRAMAESGEVPRSAHAEAVVGDALALPYLDGTFDCVIASEILEHVPADNTAIDELIRVLKVGGKLAVTVPRWFPERLCWLLSDDYHSNEGGHIRIYRANELRAKITGQKYYCHALAGESEYNLTINSDLTVSCNCQDYNGSGHIGDLKTDSLICPGDQGDGLVLHRYLLIRLFSSSQHLRIA